jgi:hypothetical protein
MFRTYDYRVGARRGFEATLCKNRQSSGRPKFPQGAEPRHPEARCVVPAMAMLAHHGDLYVR